MIWDTENKMAERSVRPRRRTLGGKRRLGTQDMSMRRIRCGEEAAGGWVGGLREVTCGTTRRKGAGVCEGRGSMGYPAETTPGWSWKLSGSKRERACESEPVSNGLCFLRKEEGPGTRTRSAWR